jgi:hypothetical protein
VCPLEKNAYTVFVKPQGGPLRYQQFTVGDVQITDTGQHALTTYPDRIDMGTLEQYPS